MFVVHKDIFVVHKDILGSGRRRRRRRKIYSCVRPREAKLITWSKMSGRKIIQFPRRVNVLSIHEGKSIIED